jgi:predicted MFS family arabinose efflux permease
LSTQKGGFRAGFISFGAIIVMAFAVNGVLDISGFETTYRSSLVAQFSIQGEEIKAKIESSLNLGKKLFLLGDQVQDYFYNTMRQSTDIEHFYVADKNNNILYSTRASLRQRIIPFAFERGVDIDSTANGQRSPPVTVRFLDACYICIPFYSENTTFEGTLLIEFSESVITNYMYKTAKSIAFFAFILLALALAAYFLLYRLIPSPPRTAHVTGLTIILLLASQITFSFHNYNFYNNAISGVFTKNITVLAKSIAENAQKSLDYNIGLTSLGKAKEYLAKRIEASPQCADIYITDINLKVLYEAHIDDNSPPRARLTRQDRDLSMLPLTSMYGSGYLVLRLNRPMINTILRNTALDSGTIIVVSLILAFIMKDFLAFVGGLGALKRTNTRLSSGYKEDSLRLIEISSFLFMFAAFEPLAFMPLYIQHVWTQNPPGSAIAAVLNEQTALSLPIGSYMLGVFSAMLLVLFVLKKMSIRNRYILMTTVFALGSVLTIFSTHILYLIAARFVSGFGYGGVLLSTSSLVIAYTDGKSRSEGFGTNAAAYAAASICAIPIGGIVVNKFGYEAGMVLSIVFALVFLAFSFFCISKAGAGSAETESAVAENTGGGTVSVKQFFRILFSRHILNYLFAMNFPFQLIYYGMFQFLLPIYMSNTLGLSQGNIGRLLSVYCVVSLSASWLGRFADRFKNDKLILVFGSSIAGIALVAFRFLPNGGLLFFAVVIVAMGIESVTIDALEEVFVSSGGIEGVSEENLLQTYKVIEKVLSIFIPTITGFIIAVSGFSSSMFIIGVVSLAGAVVFYFLGKNGRWKKQIEPGDSRL